MQESAIIHYLQKDEMFRKLFLPVFIIMFVQNSGHSVFSVPVVHNLATERTSGLKFGVWNAEH